MPARESHNTNWQRWYKIVAGEESPLAQDEKIFIFRLFALFLQYITLRWTHAAWLVRDQNVYPECPMLPLINWDWFPQFNVYGLLIGSLVLSIFFARAGFLLQSVVLFYAIIADQTRLQPEVISPLILLWGTLPSHTLRTIARVHLGTMWFYAGFHKLIAPLYQNHVGQSIMIDFLQLDLSPERAKLLGSFIPYVEMLVGVMIVFPKLRRPSAILACLMHLTIWYSVSGIPSAIKQFNQNNLERFYHDINPLNWWQPVWEWNLMLAAASLVFLWSWKTKPLLDYQRSRWGLRAVVAFLIISPITYYGGMIHPYLSHCLFSGNTPYAQIQTREQRNVPLKKKIYKPLIPQQEVTARIGLMVPPSDSSMLQYFNKTARNGDKLYLFYPQNMKLLTSLNDKEVVFGEVDGKQEGYWILYDTNGVKSEEGEFNDGAQNGHWILWNPDGTKESEGEMRDNQLHGRWLTYNSDGSIREDFYDHGKPVPAP